MKVFPYLIFLAVLVSSNSIAKTFFKGTDAAGNTIYSDTPITNGIPIEVEVPANLPAPTPPPTMLENTPAQKTENIKYQISIISPLNDETFTTDIQQIPVKLKIEPGLLPEHRIKLFLNGQALPTLYNASTMTLDALPRGAYQLQAQVVLNEDPKNAIAQSEAIQFYQKRALTRVLPAQPTH